MTSINWDAVPDDLLQKMVKFDKMPKKGISKLVFATAPWEPKHF